MNKFIFISLTFFLTFFASGLLMAEDLPDFYEKTKLNFQAGKTYSYERIKCERMIVEKGESYLHHPLEKENEESAQQIIIECDNIFFAPGSVLKVSSNITLIGYNVSGAITIIGNKRQDPIHGIDGQDGEDCEYNCENVDLNGADGSDGINGLKNINITLKFFYLTDKTTITLTSDGGKGGNGGNGGHGGDGPPQGGQGGLPGKPGLGGDGGTLSLLFSNPENVASSENINKYLSEVKLSHQKGSDGVHGNDGQWGEDDYDPYGNLYRDYYGYDGE